MGFRKDAYATVWSVQSISDVNTKLRISISRKDKQTGEYFDDFSGFVSVFGTAAAKNASMLNRGDRIKLGDVDVRTKYVKEKNVTYYNFNVYSFELQENKNNQEFTPNYNTPEAASETAGDGDLDDSRLPF